MKIELIKLKFNDTCSYKYKPFKYCCEAIQNNKNIIFTREDLVFDEVFGLDPSDYNESTVPQFCTSYTEIFNSWGDEFENTWNYPIQFCPHCGEDIKIEVVDEIDVSEEYNQLSKQRDELWKKCQKTDSKKKENELREQVRDLDNKINGFYTLSEWSGE